MRILPSLCLLIIVLSNACAQKSTKDDNFIKNFPPVIYNEQNYNELGQLAHYVINKKGTERAYTGEYYDLKADGTYICRQCNLPLFKSEDKFDSMTGWPSFDDFIQGAVEEKTDADGYRTEILCANCGGHLGHVFRGEGFTSKQTRHCVNSASLLFIAQAFNESK